MTMEHSTNPNAANIILTATQNHAPQIHLLETQCFVNQGSGNSPHQLATDSPSWSLTSVVSELANPHSHTLLLVNQTATPIAYITYRTLFGETEILRLGVTPKHRGKGYASTLLNEAVRLVTASNKPCRIRLEVSKQNMPAVRFYNKCGFIVANTRKNYYNNSDALEMIYVNTTKTKNSTAPAK